MCCGVLIKLIFRLNWTRCLSKCRVNVACWRRISNGLNSTYELTTFTWNGNDSTIDSSAKNRHSVWECIWEYTSEWPSWLLYLRAAFTCSKWICLSRDRYHSFLSTYKLLNSNALKASVTSWIPQWCIGFNSSRAGGHAESHTALPCSIDCTRESYIHNC